MLIYIVSCFIAFLLLFLFGSVIQSPAMAESIPIQMFFVALVVLIMAIPISQTINKILETPAPIIAEKK